MKEGIPEKKTQWIKDEGTISASVVCIYELEFLWHTLQWEAAP